MWIYSVPAGDLNAGSPTCSLTLKAVDPVESGTWLVGVNVQKWVFEGYSCPGSGPASSASWALLCQQLLPG